MYIKKRVLIVCSVLLIVVTAVLTVGLVNPFGFTNYLDFIKFSTVTNTIKNMYYEDVPMSDYVNSSIEGFAQGTEDAYTNYIYGEEADEYMEDVSGSFDGIGVYIENNIEDNTITVVSAISDTPAEKVGLVSGDKILKVAGVSYTGAKSLVLDLRNNPGGYIEAAVDVASNFVKSGEDVVYTLDKKGNREDYKSNGKQYYIPVTVLINQGSASASEIVTGALKDYGLAHVIGEKSYGKGIVQSVFGLGDGIVSVTIARYYTPNGTCIHKLGIEPDETVPMELNKYANLDNLTLEEDEQLSAAVNYLNSVSK